MLSIYTAELFKRVFYPTTRGADYVSVLVPLAIAMTAFFSGVKISESTTAQILAYVGSFTLLVFAFRVFFSGPYGMWKEEKIAVSSLREQLSRPERSVLEHLSRHRAKARAKMTSLLEDLQTSSYTSNWEATLPRFVGMMADFRRLQAEAGLSKAFEDSRRVLGVLIRQEGETSNDLLVYNSPSNNLMKLLQQHLVGDVTSEILEAELPKYRALVND